MNAFESIILTSALWALLNAIVAGIVAGCGYGLRKGFWNYFSIGFFLTPLFMVLFAIIDALTYNHHKDNSVEKK